MKKTPVFLLLLLVCAAGATPYYAMHDGVRCSACHLNPEGGGMRTPYAAYRFGRKGPDITLGDYLRFDAEGRFLFSAADSGNRVDTTFNAMDYRLRLNPRLDGVVDAVVSVSRFGFDEAAARVYLPEGLYVKAGRYRPPFGLTDDDHRLATREILGFHPLTWFETGAEVGWVSEGTHLAAGAYNGGGDAFDVSRGKAALGRATQWVGPVFFGGSYLYEEAQDPASGLYGTRWAAAGFLAVDLPLDIGLAGEYVFREERRAGVRDFTDDSGFWVGADFWLGPVQTLLVYDSFAADEESGSLYLDRDYLTGRVIWHAMSFFDLEAGLKYGLDDGATNYYLLQLRVVF